MSMGLNQWMLFCNEAGVVDNTRRGCYSSDLQARTFPSGHI